MKRIIFTLILFTLNNAYSSGITVGDSCVLTNPSGTCSTTIGIFNDNGAKACLWKTTGNTVEVKSCQGSSLQNWSYNWTQTSVSGDDFELLAHDNWPTHDQAGYSSGTLLDTKPVVAEYGKMTVPTVCTVTNPNDTCSTTIYVEKQGAKKACLWKTAGNTVEVKSCQGSSLHNWSYNWAQTSVTGDSFELLAHDTWPTQDPLGLTHAYSNGLLLDTSVISALLNGVPPLDPSVSFRGGTNYHWFYHQYDRNNPNDFPASATDAVLDYGIIKNYHRKFDYNTELISDTFGQSIRGIVLGQLNDMYENGQERLRVGIWHSRAESGTHGTFLNSKNKLISGQNVYLDEQYLTNIELFMTDIKNAGFEQVMFAFYPNGPNRPGLWKNWGGSSLYQSAINATFNGDQIITTITDPNNEPLWIENWRVIKQVKTRLDNSGMNYVVDLGNEVIPKQVVDKTCTQTVNDSSCLCPNSIGEKMCFKKNINEINLFQTRWEKLLAKVWTRYVNKYGVSDTVGYSIISRNASDFNQRYPTLSNVYSNGVLPNTFSLHVYDGIWIGHDDAFGGLNAAFNWKENNNMTTKFIIGETDYNDSITGQQLKSVLTGNRKLEYILQWPKGRGFLYRLDPPYDFSNYIDEGF